MNNREAAKQARKESWRATLASLAQDRGFFEEIGQSHKVLYLPQDGARGKTLVVAFDNLDDSRQSSDRLPWAVDFISSQGWSSLGFMAHGPTWYRDDAVVAFFDKLQDEKFFDQFERVVFYGTSMGGYAAAAFSAAAPGSTVVAINPQATLSRSDANWERRFRAAWRYDFGGKYSYAPDMAASAEKVWLFYDSRIKADAMHAAHFNSPNVIHIRCPFMGHGMLVIWRQMGILKDVVAGCIDGTHSKTDVHRLFRARFGSGRYLRMVLDYIVEQGNHKRVVFYADQVMKKYPRAPYFIAARKKARAALAAERSQRRARDVTQPT